MFSIRFEIDERKIYSNTIAISMHKLVKIYSSVSRTVKCNNIGFILFIFDILPTKGQIISEKNCGVLNFPNKQQNYCKDFCPSH